MTKIEILDKLKSDIHSISFKADDLATELKFFKIDVRYYFYGLFQSVTSEYYLGLNTFFFFEHIDHNKIFDMYVKNELIDFKNNHIKELFFSQLDARDSVSIENKKIKIERSKHNLERNLILGSFAVFETCINIIFEEFCDIDEFNSYVIKEMKRDNSFISKNDFTDVQKEIIIKNLTLEISLHKKMRFLTKKIANYNERKKDLDFIDFISKYRNCLSHKNGIYNVEKYEKEYFGSKFILEKGKEYKIEDIEENPISSHWKIAFEIKSIFTRLISNLIFIELIEYPN